MKRTSKNDLVALLNTLPEEALTEVERFLEQLRQTYRPEPPSPPYTPISLGGRWKGITIREDDIREARNEM